MSAVRNRIEETEHYLNEEFNFQELIVEEKEIRYKEFSAGKIIFCNGTQPNPVFNGLPIKPLKGETITLQGNTSSSIIINRGVYVLPLKENRWRVGATYNFNDTESGVTESSRIELEEKVNAICQFHFTTIDQQWGMRPTTPDRRPILGEHSQLRSVFIFNGLGTKGVSLAPYFSMILIHSTENQVPVNKEVGIERYKSVYSSSSL